MGVQGDHAVHALVEKAPVDSQRRGHSRIAIQAEVSEAIAQTDGRRLMVGPGCVLPVHTPAIHIRAAIEAVTEQAMA